MNKLSLKFQSVTAYTAKLTAGFLVAMALASPASAIGQASVTKTAPAANLGSSASVARFLKAQALWPYGPVIEAQNCITSIVAEKMNIRLRPEIKLPTLKVEGDVKLSEFQDAAEKSWGMRPDAFLNMYQPEKNQVFLMANANYYLSRGRSIFDSLAHEIVHVMQVLYQAADFTTDSSDHYEGEAVRIQTWFRDQYGKGVEGWHFNCPQESTTAPLTS